jgi:hypothetical protein
MSPRKIIRLLCAGLLLTIALWMGWEVVTKRRAEAAAEAARASRARMLDQLDKLRASVARMARRQDTPINAAPAEASLKNVDSPDQLHARLRVLHAWMSLRYSRLYRKAGFSPDQIQKFESLLEDHYLRNLDLVATARAEGIPFGDPTITQLSKEENARYNSALEHFRFR